MQQETGQKAPMGALILIISSRVPIIGFFRTGLKFSGYTTQSCQYGPEIVTVARDAKPSLILVEFNAPNDDNLLLFKQLREVVPQACPILVLTEQASDQKFQKINPTSLISIPCDFDTVLVQINALIGHLNPQLSQPRRGFLYPVVQIPGLNWWLSQQLSW